MARSSRGERRGHGSREIAVSGYARIDRDRGHRVGVPEVILGEGKSVEHLLGIVRSCAAAGHGALISRPTLAQSRALTAAGGAPLPLRSLADGRLLRLAGPLGGEYRPGVVAVVTAGTSDVPIAEEARAILEEFGLEVVTAYDVGVAGLHRLLRAVRRLERAQPEIYLAFAGREGALPTVLAGLVRAPVVGVPTSAGYGRGGRGNAALNAMLQSCAPIAVVNIDAAVPAALFAAQRFAVRARSAPRRRPSRRRPPRTRGRS
ncbi:MAG: nickel pincer cofactor biosynthesis protein LarB [Thermoplasmata archaeon]